MLNGKGERLNHSQLKRVQGFHAEGHIERRIAVWIMANDRGGARIARLSPSLARWAQEVHTAAKFVHTHLEVPSIHIQNI